MPGSRLLLSCCLAALAAGPPRGAEAFAPLSAPGRAFSMSTSQRRLLEALESPTSLNCHDAPLDKALEYLSRLHGIEIKLDRNSLSAAGIAADTPVTEALEGVTLRSALRLMLRDLKLGYVLQGGALVVASADDAAARVYSAAYPVGDLVGPRAAGGVMKLDTAGLVTALRDTIAPETWKGEDRGGTGLVRAVPPGEARFLAVIQTGEVQQRVADFLEQVRFAVRSKAGRTTAAAERGSLRLAAEERIRRALEAPADAKLKFVECPLGEALAQIAALHRVAVRMDRQALDDVGLAADTPVTADLAGVPLGSAMRLMLRNLDLNWVVDCEVVLVTTPEDAQGRLLSTRLHAVDDPPERRGPSGLHRVPDDDLVDLVLAVIAPVSWEEVGGPGIVAVVRKDAARSLVVTQSQEVHDQIDQLLDDLRRAAAGPAAMQPDGTVNLPRPSEKRIDKALGTGVGGVQKGTPLADVLDSLSKMAGVPIRVDKKALDDVGVGMDAPVDCDLNGISLRQTLEIALRPLSLTWMKSDDVLLVTTPEEAENRLSTRTYPVTDLMPAGQVQSEGLEAIAEMVQRTVAPVTWDDVGGPGSIAPVSLGVEKVLVVAQTEAVHRQIADLLGELRRVSAPEPRPQGARPAPGAAPPPAWSGLVSPAEAKIVKALDQPTTLEFIDTPLADVAEWVQDLHGIPVTVDKKALDDVGIGTDSPVTFKLKGVSLRTGLERVLRPLDLTFDVRASALWITTPEEAESHLHLQVHPVTDLLARMGPGDPDFDSLIDAITSTVRPTTWDDVGGPGSIAPLTVGRTHVLVFSQTWQVHEEVGSLLARLRVAAGLVKPAESGAWPSVAEVLVVKALKTPVSLGADKTPLGDVLDQLRKQAGVEIVIDRKALDDVGVGTDTPITAGLGQVTLAFALEQVLKDTQLAYLVDREYILVTSEEEAQSRLTTEVYRIDWRAATVLAPGAADGSFDALLEAVTEKIEPESWDVAGGPGSIAPLALGRTSVLVVSQTWAIHRKLAKALGTTPVRGS